MSEDMIVGRKAIIEFLRIPLQLSMDYDTAWRKIRRWKRRFDMWKLFHHLPNTSPYLLRSEIEIWLHSYDKKQQAKASKKYLKENTSAER